MKVLAAWWSDISARNLAAGRAGREGGWGRGFSGGFGEDEDGVLMLRICLRGSETFRARCRIEHVGANILCDKSGYQEVGVEYNCHRITPRDPQRMAGFCQP